jgi:hypothetical protein
MSGSFIIIVSKRKNGRWELRPSFEILTNISNLEVMNRVQEFFGVGKVYINSKQCIYRVSRLNDLTSVIIPHFASYPLISRKSISFQLWSQAISLFQSKAHLQPHSEGFYRILSLYASLNRGVSPAVATHFPNIIPTNLPSYSLPTILNPFWISGYLSLNCNMKISITASINKKGASSSLFFSFSFTRQYSELPLIKLISEYFGVGNVTSRSKQDRCEYNLVDRYYLKYLFNNHFSKFPFNSPKDLKMALFMEALDLAESYSDKDFVRIYKIIELMGKE